MLGHKKTRLGYFSYLKYFAVLPMLGASTWASQSTRSSSECSPGAVLEREALSRLVGAGNRLHERRKHLDAENKRLAAESRHYDAQERLLIAEGKKCRSKMNQVERFLDRYADNRFGAVDSDGSGRVGKADPNASMEQVIKQANSIQLEQAALNQKRKALLQQAEDRNARQIRINEEMDVINQQYRAYQLEVQGFQENYPGSDYLDAVCAEELVNPGAHYAALKRNQHKKRQPQKSYFSRKK